MSEHTWTPDKERPWWSWRDDNPDVIAKRSDGMELEQVPDGWQFRLPSGPVGWIRLGENVAKMLEEE